VYLLQGDLDRRRSLGVDRIDVAPIDCARVSRSSASGRRASSASSLRPLCSTASGRIAIV